MYDHSVYTAESVTSGHPDKVCDQISDAILDACLQQDPKSRVAVETMGAHGVIFIGGEITTNADIKPAWIARKVYRDLGYDGDISVRTNIVKQSPDISMGVDTGGAGDQGIMYGYATNETDEYLPHAIVLAHKLTKGLEQLRKNNKLTWLRPDGKSQVTIEKGKVKKVVVSTQHEDGVSQKKIRDSIEELLIRKLVGNRKSIEVFVNPTGKFVLGGFDADTGLTGRKIMVDTYGGIFPHGGGCFSGKDPTKVDRSAAYMSRFVAKNLVSKGLANRCLVSVAYAIGKEEPLMVTAVNEKGQDLSSFVNKYFDFRPLAIIERLELRKPIYRQTASYGHFGKDGLPWEEIVI